MTLMSAFALSVLAVAAMNTVSVGATNTEVPETIQYECGSDCNCKEGTCKKGGCGEGCGCGCADKAEKTGCNH